ncbi:universal stress protein [Jatrophihabitans sp. YIM 134969]
MTESTESTEPAVAPIVVGVSPTSGSIAAVEWALDHARRVGAPLVAVTAWQVPVGAAPSIVPSEQAAVVERLAEEASQNLAKTVRALAGESSSVSQRVERGAASAVLVRASESAQLLVVGPPHPGELSKLRPSLLVPQVVYGAACPVVVLPQVTYEQPSRWRSFAGRLAEAAATAGRPGPGVRLPPPDPT